MKTTNKELYKMWYKEKQWRLDLQLEVKVLREQIADNERSIRRLNRTVASYHSAAWDADRHWK